MRGKEVKPLHSLQKHELAGGCTPIACLPLLISSDEQWEQHLWLAEYCWRGGSNSIHCEKEFVTLTIVIVTWIATIDMVSLEVLC